MSREEPDELSGSDIAIIGLACRMPDAQTPAEFWSNLKNGRESIQDFAPEEMTETDTLVSKEPNYIRAGAILENPELFDAAFFGYSPREAVKKDPQHRVFLECAWEALEESGYSATSSQSRVGVFASCGPSTYLANNPAGPTTSFLRTMEDLELSMGNDRDYVSAHVSYKLDLKGPSISLQTACSSSLVVVHLACQSLLTGESDIALAGATFIRFPQKVGYLYEESMVFSPDGRCRAFDKDANGTVFGHGAGVVALKRLCDAIKDGDLIHAVIKGSAVNNDGSGKVGFSAPSVQGQAAVIAEAISIAGVKSSTISYIEAHGTATSLGDPIEIEALTRAFKQTGTKMETGFCAIGSVKTNIGHLAYAAGMAGLIKTVLCLKHKQIAPSLNFDQPNPKIQFATSPFFVNSTLRDWVSKVGPRRAGVSAFGLGGTNAHIVLEEAPKLKNHPKTLAHGSHILTLSAKSETALHQLAAGYLHLVEDQPNQELANISFTAAVFRRHFEHRCALVADSTTALAAKIKGFLQQEMGTTALAPATTKKMGKIVFLFSGQGSQYFGMGRQLYECNEVFRATLDSCHEASLKWMKVPLLEVLFDPSNAALINNIEYTQACIYAVEVALAKMWASWGIKPDLVLGHSTGEYAASHIAGLFSLEDGLHLSIERGRLMSELVSSDGKMLAVRASEKTVTDALQDLDGAVSVAVVNGPESIVLSGTTLAVHLAGTRLKERNIDSKELQVARAGHCELMDPVLEPFELFISKKGFKSPTIDYVSCVTGKTERDLLLKADYWTSHLRKPVRFYDALLCANDLGASTFIEIGPQNSLLGLGMSGLPNLDAIWVPSLVGISNGAPCDEWQKLLESVGKLYSSGLDINWIAFYHYRAFQKISLPTYPFQRQSFLLQSSLNNSSRPQQRVLQPEAEANIPSAWKDWLCEIRWTSEKNDHADSKVVDDLWVIFADKGGLAKLLNEKLKHRGLSTAMVWRGPEFSRLTDIEFTLNAEVAQNFTTLFETLPKNKKLKIVYMWSIDVGDEPSGPISMLSSLAPLFLTQALLQDPGIAAAIRWVTRGAQAVVSEDEVSGYTQSLLWGLGKVILLEHPELDSKLIDLDHNHAPCISEIFIEDLFCANLVEDQIAYRSNKRFVARLAKLNATPIIKPVILTEISSAKTYVITGGLGGLGILFSQWLADKGAKHIVLLTRQSTTAIPAALKSQHFKHTKVHIERCDVGVADEVKDLFAKLSTLPPLGGIIHAAGVIDDGALLSLNRERFEKVLTSKLQGSKNLADRIVQSNTALDFLVFFSSQTSMIGNRGQANHAAANSFMDSFCAYLRGRKIPALTINWGPWEKVGRLVAHAEVTQKLNKIGVGSIAPKMGLEIFEWILRSGRTQTGVLPVDWPKFIKQHSLEDAGFFKGLADARAAATQLSDIRLLLINATSEQKRLLLIPIVQAELAKILNLNASFDQDGMDLPFPSFGLDSLTAILLRNNLQKILRCRLPVTIAFRYPTVHKLVGFVSDTFAMAEPLNNVEVVPVPQPKTQEIQRSLSMQQTRWLRLLKQNYGKLVVPIVFSARLNKVVFLAALRSVMVRHEILRCRFEDDFAVVMSIDSACPKPEDLFDDVSELSREDRRKRLGELAELARKSMPDFRFGIPWKLKCIKLDDNQFILLLSLQHLEFDGTSVSIFVDDLRRAYHALTSNLLLPTAPAPQYAQYVELQKNYMTSKIREDRAFFLGLYSGLRTTTRLSPHKNINQTSSLVSGAQAAETPIALYNMIRRAAIHQQISEFAILSLAYSKLIGEITSRQDVVIGSIFNGRPLQELTEIIGPFVAPFPLRVWLGDRSARDNVHYLNNIIAEINSRSLYPPSDLIDHCPAFKGHSIDTYFTDAFIMLNNYRHEAGNIEPQVEVLECLEPISAGEFSSLECTQLPEIAGLFLVIDVYQENYRFNFWYHLERFPTEQVRQWSNRYLQIICEVLNELNQ